MNCKRAQTNLKAFIDKELGWFTRGRLTRHLRGCPHCERTLRTMQELTDIIQDAEPVDPPGDFKTKVMAKIAAEIQTSRPGRSSVYRQERRFTGWAPVYAFLAGAVTVWSFSVLQRHLVHAPSPVGMKEISEAKTSSLYEVRVRLRVDDASDVADMLGRFGAVTQPALPHGSICVTVPRERFSNLEATLAHSGKILDMKYGYSSLGTHSSVRVYVEPVVE